MAEDDDAHDDEHSTEDIWLAILFVVMTGLMITVGGFLSFLIPARFSQALPISLAFSAGVLIYLAFVEIFPATEEGFDTASDEEWIVHIYTSLTFFGGILIGAVLDQVVHKLGHEHDHHHTHHTHHAPTQVRQTSHLDLTKLERNNSNITLDNKDASSVPITVDSGLKEGLKTSNGNGNLGLAPEPTDLSHDNGSEANETNKMNKVNNGNNGMSFAEQKKLMRVSLTTAIAVSLHNLPEGLATFIGTIADPAIGFSIAIAVAIHNIPLGISIATPVYRVTRSKWKAIGIATLAGITQPIGGLIGLIVIETGVSEVGFSIMFGITGGLMIYTCFRELLPAARHQDPEDVYTSWLVFVGMLVLDVSLVLFDSNGGHEHRRRFYI